MEQLLAIMDLQKKPPHLLMDAERLKNEGDLEAAGKAYEELVRTQKQLLAAVLRFNEAPPTGQPFDLPPFVNVLLDALLTRADVLEALGRQEQAERLRTEATELSRQHLPAYAQAERQRQRAEALVLQGRFNEALDAFLKAIAAFRKEKRVVDTAIATADLAGILEWLGDYERAREESKKAADLVGNRLAEIGPGGPGILGALASGDLKLAEERAKLLRVSVEIQQIEARVCRYLGRWAEAERLFRQVQPRIPEVAQPAIEFQIAAIRVGQGRFREGLDLARKLQPAFSGLLQQKLGVLLKLQAEALLGLDEPAAALRLLEESVRALGRFHDPDSLWKVHWFRGRVLAALGRAPEALAAYGDAAGIVNGLRKAPLGHRLDSTYLRDKMPMFRSAIDLAADHGEAETCCRLLEMVKSRILTATLSVPAAAGGVSAGPLEQQVDDLTRRIDGLECSAASAEWTEDLRFKRERLLSERTRLLEQIRITEPRWRTLTEPAPFDLKKVMERLAGRRQSALTLYYQADRVTAVLLKGGRASAGTVALSDATRGRLEQYIQNFHARPFQAPWFDLSVALGVTADRLVPAELLREAVAEGGLLFVPHGPLHLVPWAGLLWEGKRLFERCPVGVLPNLSSLLFPEPERSPRPRVALLGAPDYSRFPGEDELDGAETEMESIEELFAPRGGVLGRKRVGRDATKAAFWELAGDAQAASSILHVACHAGFEKDEPMRSGLLLSDGRVDAAEIARRRLTFEEVVLSGCSTGERPMAVGGIPLAGDDILGLPGAFLEAGVRSVLVSIPPAEDRATARLTGYYHEGRASGVAPLPALQEAQKMMLADSGHPPHLWIGFTAYSSR